MNLKKVLKSMIFITLLESCFKLYLPKGVRNNNKEDDTSFFKENIEKMEYEFRPNEKFFKKNDSHIGVTPDLFK